MTGAVLYGTVIAAPAVGTIAGMQAEYYLGASVFTQTVVPAITTTGTYGLVATTGVYAANDIYASNSGYNVILDKVFHNDVGKYEAAGMVLYALNGAVVEYVAANEFLLNAKKGIQFEGGSKGGSDVWDMTEGGGIINGREYSQHAMERRRQIRHQLEQRHLQNQRGYKLELLSIINFVRSM